MLNGKYLRSKEVVLFLALTAVLFCPLSSVRAEDETTAVSDNLRPVLINSENVFSSVESVKKVKEEVNKEASQIMTEKDAIQKEKQELEKSVQEMRGQKEGVKKEEGAQVINEKLETVKKKEDVVKAREAVLDEKIKAYEKITRLVERELSTLDNKKISLGFINNEFSYAEKEVRRLENEKRFLIQQASQLEREKRSIEKNITAKKFIMEFKEDDRPGLAETIQAQEERLGAATDELMLIQSRIELIDSQVGIVKDYSHSLQEKQLEYLKDTLLVSRPFVCKAQNFLWGGLLFLFCVFGVINRKRLGDALPRKESSFAQWFVNKVIRVSLFAGLIFIPLYFLFSCFGYHELIVYAGKKTAVLGAITAFSIILHNRLVAFIRFFCKDHVEESGKKICHPVTSTLSTVIGWMLFLFGCYFALKMFGFERRGVTVLTAMAQYPLLTLKDIHISLWVIFKSGFIIWLFVVFARVVNNFLSKSIYPRTKLDKSIQYTISITIKYILFIIGGFIGLKALGIDLGALAIFAGTVGIGIGLGLQEIAKNFISGLIILFERPIKIGDYIEVGGLPGQVRSIEARSTIVDTFDNISVIVPNGEFMTQRVINWSHSDRVIRVVLPVGVAYGSDTKLVRDSLLEVAGRHQKVLKKPAPYVWFEEFGESALNFKLFVWTEDTGNRLQLRSDLNYMIDHIFRERGITIAFPQCDLHIKSSDVVFKIDGKDK